MNELEKVIEAAEQAIVAAKARHSPVCFIFDDDLKKLIVAAKLESSTHDP